MVSLMDLPVEMRLYLYDFLPRNLSNFSFTSKQSYLEVKPFLWKYTCVPYTYADWFIDREQLDIIKDNMFSFTESICFCNMFDIQTELAGGIFEYLLERCIRMCNMKKLCRVSVTHCLTSTSFKWVFNKLPNLRELRISQCFNIDASAYSCIIKAKHFKRLTMEDSYVDQATFKNLMKLNNLEEFRLVLSDRRGCGIALEDVFSMVNIRKLTISVPGLSEYFPLTKYACYDLGKLVKLEYLNLSHTPINNDWLETFIVHSAKLQVVVCYGCTFLSDVILKNLASLTLLDYVDVRCTKVSLRQFQEFTRRMGMKEISRFVASKKKRFSLLEEI